MTELVQTEAKVSVYRLKQWGIVGWSWKIEVRDVVDVSVVPPVRPEGYETEAGAREAALRLCRQTGWRIVEEV